MWTMQNGQFNQVETTFNASDSSWSACFFVEETSNIPAYQSIGRTQMHTNSNMKTKM